MLTIENRPKWLCSLKLAALAALPFMPQQSFAQDYPIVQMIKRNASTYAIEGNSGGADGQDVYIWTENESNSNQQWYEIDRGNGYYSFQKVGTTYCIDGNSGGDLRQNVYLWTCGANN
ncbi:MAG: RICIN domain-containing protein, partial [Acidiferrobacterales bacterium]|nr:RICIN domain-containing protein [Acidiferrobacterales bacterium]